MPTLLERAEREGTPFIDSETVTFVWYGPDVPELIDDSNYWGNSSAGSTPMQEVETNVWSVTKQLPLDAYIEYAFRVRGEQVIDSFNKRWITDGVGGFHSYFKMPRARSTGLTGLSARIPHGVVTTHVIESGNLLAGGKRKVHVYQPPTDQPSPLLVVFDGQDYLKRARLTRIVDNLIAKKRIRPIALAMIEHGKQARFLEYCGNDATVAVLLRHVLPLANSYLKLIDPSQTPGAFGVLGASMGGLIALYTALRAPEIFGKVLSQSGAFGLVMGIHEMMIFDLVRDSARKPLTIWMDVGRYEWLLTANQKMKLLLEEKGYSVTYREYSGGHNYTSWRNEVWRGLEVLFPPEKLE